MEPDSRIRPFQQNLEIVDAGGRVLPWFQTSVNVEASRVTLTLVGAPRVDEPKELRYYRLSQTMVDVPFSFNDVPMP